MPSTSSSRLPSRTPDTSSCVARSGPWQAVRQSMRCLPPISSASSVRRSAADRALLMAQTFAFGSKRPTERPTPTASSSAGRAKCQQTTRTHRQPHRHSRGHLRRNRSRRSRREVRALSPPSFASRIRHRQSSPAAGRGLPARDGFLESARVPARHRRRAEQPRGQAARRRYL